ncbi:MAG: DEAD/DEAH box helicase [Candidatus Dadabacteria bacterium]|nr:MAG: DEAD/DEAH box helicase [Candidatus Dadabacteria bacterium]
MVDEQSGVHVLPRPLWPLAAVRELDRWTGPVTILVPDAEALADALDMLRAVRPDRRIEALPGWDVGLYDHAMPDPRIVARRAVVAEQLSREQHDVLLLEAAAPLVPLVRFPGPATISLTVDDELGPDLLVERGYLNVPEVSSPGEFAVRGEIIDVWSPLEERPVRIDRFDNLIETMRVFDPVSQMTARPVEHVRLGYASVRVAPWDDPDALERRIRNRIRNSGASTELTERLLGAVRSAGESVPALPLWWTLAGEIVSLPPRIDFAIGADAARDVFNRARQETVSERRRLVQEGWPLPGWQSDEFDMSQIGEPETVRRWRLRATSMMPSGSRDPVERLRSLLPEANHRLRIWVTGRPGDRAVADELLRQAGWACADEATDEPRVARYIPHRVRGHWELPDEQLRVIDVAAFVRRHRQQERARDARLDVSELHPGDYVVHELYGIGRFIDLHRVTVDERTVDVVRLEYAGGDRLLVPVAQLAYVSLYRGAGEEEPRMDRLGGEAWQRRKAKVREDLLRFAGELLDIYAARERARRDPLPPPGELSAAVEAGFPWDETSGQQAALADIEGDLAAPHPMDRLVVGDVGYGKTEIALRTAVRFAENGYQVAVLVPTTVLAAQHGRTFHDRLKHLPIRVAVLSRFVGAAQQRRILQDVADGKIDIVIGTHRLLQHDVRFARLGLLIIDEEHRFGVKHKEAFKALRRDVDVLAMSATPIPRTLQLHIGGFRAMSVIATPPPGRLGVETRVQPWDADTVREALVRERLRGGQAFYLLNEIDALEGIASQLSELVPDLRIGVAHGKMRPRAVEDVFQAFGAHELDVLVATTIIESGIDFPRANTLIVHDAHMHGLADLYQLRGRVGRSDRRAYAYLLYPGDTQLSEQARQRLDVLRSFSNLGAGFQIAMRDLEIRGAGEMLGKKQAGHIAAIGMQMMLRLLDEALHEAQGIDAEPVIEPDIHADFSLTLSEAWLPEVEARLRAYQQFARARTTADVLQVERELVDRFGAPAAQDRLYIRAMSLRPRLRDLCISKLTIQPTAAVLHIDASTPLQPAALAAIAAADERLELRPDGLRIAIDGAPEERIEAVREWLERLTRDGRPVRN